jgi:RND family efflux transporter MFP subunit
MTPMHSPDVGRQRGQARCRFLPLPSALPVALPVALLVAVAAIAGCRRASGDAAAEAEQHSAVQLGPENVAVVTPGLVRSGPVISGTLAPVRNAQIRAQVGGSVLEITAEQGQHVSAGRQLARIDAAGLTDAYASARSALASARTAAEYAARQVQRYDTLLAAGAVSDRDRETVVEQNAQAQATLTDAQARVVSAEKQLAYTVVRAPFDGVVAEREVSAGDVVQSGTMMYSVVDPSQLQLQASVAAEQIAAVRVGQPVTFTLNGSDDRTIAGTVTRINPVADVSTRQVQLYATVPNVNGALVAGLFATGRVVTDSAHGLTAPAAAIDTRNLRPAVERVRGGHVERLDVQLGLRDPQSDRVQITAGVTAGDTLLLGSAQAIAPGTPVRVTAVADTTTAER